jgi:hypothetical protein
MKQRRTEELLRHGDFYPGLMEVIRQWIREFEEEKDQFEINERLVRVSSGRRR